jgi:hypothetical protein
MPKYVILQVANASTVSIEEKVSFSDIVGQAFPQVYGDFVLIQEDGTATIVSLTKTEHVETKIKFPEDLFVE